jgi:hypothetical protein
MLHQMEEKANRQPIEGAANSSAQADARILSAINQPGNIPWHSALNSRTRSPFPFDALFAIQFITHIH